MELSLPTKDEFVSRWNAAKEQLETSNLDLLFVYSNDRAMHGPGNVRYFSDFPAHFEDTAVLIAKEGEPVLLTGPECKEYAQTVSFIDDIRVIEEFAMPDEEYPFTEMTSIADLVDELCGRTGRDCKRLGLVGLDIIPQMTFERVTEALSSGIEIIDAAKICWALRSKKSQWEQSVIQQGYELTGLVLERVLDILKPGITEFEVAAEIESIQRRQGCEATAVDTIVSFGQHNTYPIVNRPGKTVLKKNDFGLLTFGPRLHGYNPAIGRPFFVGKVPNEVLNAAKAALEAQKQCQEALKPGQVGGEVETVARNVLKKYKLEKYFVYAGIHSVGLAEFEPPILGPESKEVIEPGMIFSIDIPIFLTPWGGLRFEDGFLITEDGNIHLSDYHREIIGRGG